MKLGTIAEDYILTEIGEDKILSYFLGVTHIPCTIKSPLRIDNNPSLGIKVNKYGKIFMYDFGGSFKGGLLDFLKEYWNMTSSKVIEKVKQEYSGIIAGAPVSIFHKGSSENNNNVNTEIQSTTRCWSEPDIDFWARYGVPLDWVKFGDIHPISFYFLNVDNSLKSFPVGRYSYTYLSLYGDKILQKIYQPFNLYNKWLSGFNGDIIDFLDKIPNHGDKLVITSSRKDSLCVWSCSGIPAINPQSETTNISDDIIRNLKDRFNNIYILFDNDKAGVLYGKKMAARHSLHYRSIPDSIAKDPSDYHWFYGLDKTTQLILHLCS